MGRVCTDVLTPHDKQKIPHGANSVFGAYFRGKIPHIRVVLTCIPAEGISNLHNLNGTSARWVVVTVSFLRDQHHEFKQF